MNLPKKVPKPLRKRIVNQVIQEYQVSEQDFFSNTRVPNVVRARKKAIKLLLLDGAYPAEIARLIGREISIVRYHIQDMDPETKRIRKERYAQWWLNLRADPIAYEEHLKKRRKLTKAYYPRRKRKHDQVNPCLIEM